MYVCFCFSSRRRHTSCALVTGVQTCALPISTSRQRMVAIDMTRGDADGLKKTLAGIRTLSEHYGSTYMTFAVVDHSGGIDDAQIRVRHDLMDAVLLADGGMQRTRNLEEMLSYIQDRYGSRVDNRLEATGEAEPEIAAAMHPCSCPRFRSGTLERKSG